jgi:D-alanine--poly(phosphoribitol) ligase subunit 2
VVVDGLLLDPQARNAARHLSVMNTTFPEKVLQLVASVAETDEVRTNLELPLYECQLLDSIKTVELMIGIEEEFGLKISPAEFERENWETPRKIIADLESRMQVKG